MSKNNKNNLDSFYARYAKRFLDFFFSLVALIILSPLMLILNFLVLIFLGAPAIFKQERPGKDEKVFMIYKFRTMTSAKDAKGKMLPDSQRLTKFGRLLRSTSLDELPELINILKGDMSFVGPRPLLVEYLPKYNKEQKKRHDVLPGLTGYAQVNGRNTLKWKDKFIDDVWYVENISFWLDVKIVFKTIGAVFRRSGISSGTSATMEKFEGEVQNA